MQDTILATVQRVGNLRRLRAKRLDDIGVTGGNELAHAWTDRAAT